MVRGVGGSVVRVSHMLMVPNVESVCTYVRTRKYVLLCVRVSDGYRTRVEFDTILVPVHKEGVFFFSIPFTPEYHLRPSILSLLVVTQIRGHIAGSSPPLLTTNRALHFYGEKISAHSSLVDSHRIALTHARHSQQLIFFIFANIFYISE